MSKHKLVSIRNIHREWERLVDWDINDTDILAYATNFARQNIAVDQYRHLIDLFEVERYEFDLPEDFALIVQAAYNRFPHRPKLIKEVGKWTQDAFNDCELEIELKCPRCGGPDCSCDEPILEIPVDEMYRQANPQINSYMKHYLDHGGITDYNTYKCYYHPEFILMRPKSGYFHNLEYHVSNCIHKNIDCPIAYEIVDGRKMVVNFEEGQVLLSYLARPTDEDGLLLVPDIDELWEGMIYYIAERESFAQYMTDPSQRNRARWTDMQIKRGEFAARVRMRLKIPDPDRFEQITSNHWHKVVPYYNWWENSNLFVNDTHAYPR